MDTLKLDQSPAPCKMPAVILSEDAADLQSVGSFMSRVISGLRQVKGEVPGDEWRESKFDTIAVQCIMLPVTFTFVETPHFTRQITDCVSDDDYWAFQQELLADPERGDLLAGCHGLRKVRMALGSHGKSGGARVIYLHLPEDHVLYLFLLFKKSDQANLSKSQRNQLGLLADQIKSAYARKRKNP